jgi:hypothetical protein
MVREPLAIGFEDAGSQAVKPKAVKTFKVCPSTA